MDRKTYFLVAGIIFTLVALFHLVRIFAGWPVIIGDWSVPEWVSWVALIVAGGLAHKMSLLAIVDIAKCAEAGQRDLHIRYCARSARAGFP
jgi:hypothetical protein